MKNKVIRGCEVEVNNELEQANAEGWKAVSVAHGRYGDTITVLLERGSDSNEA